MRRRWLFLTLVLLAPASAARAASCPGADTPVAATTAESAKAAVLCLVNAERTARGLPAVAGSAQLALAAQRHTDDMVARRFFEHDAPAPAPFGVDPGARITAAGYAWQAYGENIAEGQVTPREAMTGWMASEGHCRNVLDPGVTQLGVGVAAVPATFVQAQGGTWTQDFANPVGTRAPAASGAPQAGCPYAAPAGDETARPAASASTTTHERTRVLRVAVRHAGNALIVSGRLRPAPRHRPLVDVRVRRGTRTLRHARARLGRRGRFHVRFSELPGRGALTVRVAVSKLRVTRTVGR